MSITVYRNLNKAKRDPSTFVWSVAVPSLKADGTPKRERGKLRGHTSSVVVARPEAVTYSKTLSKIARGEQSREVAAWITGAEMPQGVTLAGERRMITINPTNESKGGRRELVFYYCAIEGGRVVAVSPVVWTDVLAVEFTKDGACAIMKG